MAKVRVNVEVDSSEIIGVLCEDLSEKELIQFIKDLDLSMANWEFTIKLCEHFAKLKEEFLLESED